MRLLLVCGILLAACSTPGADADPKTVAGPGKPTRVVLNTYRSGLAGVFIVENLAGRDLAELRSRRLDPNQPAVSYVEDDVMGELLRLFRKLGFDDHAQARPRDPTKYGAQAELTVIRADGTMRSLLKKRLPPGQADRDQLAALRAYVDCKSNFLALYNRFRPEMQATAGGNFGVQGR